VVLVHLVEQNRGAIGSSSLVGTRRATCLHGGMNEALPNLMESADSALVVVTTTAEDERAGCVVAFHSQSSIEPERYSVWLSKANHTYQVSLRAEHLAVHFLGEHDLELARRFGTKSEDEVDKFADLDWSPGPGGVPLIDDLPHRLVFRRTSILDDGGDHVCVTGEVLAVDGEGGFTPLRLSDAADWEPGHEPEERAIDPGHTRV
jgi:flavin reductase (DIM6/NTAB) family NADH-FMN oxidoreductase RutF